MPALLRMNVLHGLRADVQFGTQFAVMAVHSSAIKLNSKREKFP